MSELQAESPDDPRMIGTYRPFSGWAIVAMVMSLLSGITLLNQDLSFLSLVAIGVSLIACIRIGFSRKQLLGGSMALFSLALAGFFFAAGAYYSSLWREHLFALGRNNADTWLGLIRNGEIYRPYHFFKKYPERFPASTDLEEYYTELPSQPNQHGDCKLALDNYVVQEPEVSMRKYGDRASFEFVRNHSHLTSVKTDLISLEYVLKWPAESGREDWPFFVLMQRTNHNPPMGPQWSVVDIQSLPENPKFERRMMGFGIED
jgi:hypothetical protein